MKKEVYLAGSDHLNHDYQWLLEQIRDIGPDCVTLEKSLDSSATLYWQFEKPVDELIKEHSEDHYIEGEFAAGIHYARQSNKPVFCIDEYAPFSVALKTNMNEGRNHEILRTASRMGKPEKAGEFEEWTRRNGYMGFGINYLSQIEDYDKIVHIGGRGHYDALRCNPLQEMLVADAIEVIDAVEKSRTSI